jgi:hypothetical protein
MKLFLSTIRLNRAYEIGNSRGTSLELGYFSNSKGDIFISNPSSSGGIILFATGQEEFWAFQPKGFSNFNMYEARN